MKKEEQIRMLLHPEEYTDEQLDQMLDETNVPVPDADEEWKKFESRIANPQQQRDSQQQGTRRWLRVAAAFIGVLMLSGITYAAVHMIRSQETRDREQETVAAANAQHSTHNTQLAEQDSTAMKPVVYEDTELATILNEIATFYQYEVVYKNEASKHIRLYFTWNQKVTIDELIGTFNKFERIHITSENKKLIVE